MSCNVYQDRILDYEQLTAAEQQSVDAHLQVCPECRKVAREWRALDHALTRQLQAPAVSANFDAQLLQRIAREPAAAAKTDLAQRRRALEPEYAIARQARTERPWIPQLLDVLGFGTAGGLGGWLLATLLTQTSAAATASQALTGLQMLVVSSAVGILFALGLVALAFHRPMRLALLR